MRALIPILLTLILSSCAVNKPGSRTFNFGPDGATITSETTELPADKLVESEKEKTRQICYKQLATKKSKMDQLADSQPLVYALIAQTDAINNAVSLAITKKPYDPCPSSTNSSDVEIADSAMYTSIYHDAFSLVKTLGLAWFAKEAVSDVVDAIAKGSAFSVATAGDGSPVTISEAANKASLGNGSVVEAGLFNKTSPPPATVIVEPSYPPVQ